MDNNSIEAKDYFLDITNDVCPMTFVRTRILIEKMPDGARAEIILTGEEPLQNVPESLTELGHVVEEITPIENGNHRLVVRKSG